MFTSNIGIPSNHNDVMTGEPTHSTLLAPVPLSIFRSNSKFDENSECSSFEYIRPITMIFCTRHDSDTVVACAKHRCDQPRIFYTRVFWIFIEMCLVLCEGNRRPLVDSPSQKEGNGEFWCFFSVVSLNNILKKQSRCPIFQAPWRPSDVTVMQREVMNKFHISNSVKISMWSQSLSICVVCTCKLPMLFMTWQVLSVSIQCFTLGLNSLRPRRDRRHFADDSFKCVFLNENEWISLRISLKFVPKVRNNNIPSLVQIMAWRRPGDKPLSEPMVVSLPTHICVTRPQWVYSI